MMKILVPDMGSSNHIDICLLYNFDCVWGFLEMQFLCKASSKDMVLGIPERKSSRSACGSYFKRYIHKY